MPMDEKAPAKTPPRTEERRVQRVNNDIVVEITTQQPVKTRVSEQALLRKKTYLTGALSRFQADLDAVNAQLTQLYEDAAQQ